MKIYFYFCSCNSKQKFIFILTTFLINRTKIGKALTYFRSPTKTCFVTSLTNFTKKHNPKYNRCITSFLVCCENDVLKFIYSEKATQFCEIYTIDLTVTTQDKSTVEFHKILLPSQNTLILHPKISFCPTRRRQALKKMSRWPPPHKLGQRAKSRNQ